MKFSLNILNSSVNERPWPQFYRMISSYRNDFSKLEPLGPAAMFQLTSKVISFNCISGDDNQWTSSCCPDDDERVVFHCRRQYSFLCVVGCCCRQRRYKSPMSHCSLIFRPSLGLRLRNGRLESDKKMPLIYRCHQRPSYFHYLSFNER